MLRHQRRSGERGQTLALAVVFLAFFAVFAAAVLGFASVTQSQRAMTEKTASINSIADGSAQFAMADTGVQGCSSGLTGGTMKFPTGGGATDTLSYTTSGAACHSSSTSAPGQNCGLCVLNFGGGTAISVQKGNWTVPGEIDANGSVSAASIGSGVRIGLYGAGATCSGCTSAPTTLPSQVQDPLSGAIPIPTPGANQGSPSSGTICPGTYTNVSGSVVLAPWGTGPCAASSSPSLYIVTGSLGGSIVANGSTIYLTSTATIGLIGGNSMSIDCGGPPVPATCSSTTPTSGPYAGVAVFMDPANTTQIKLNGGTSMEVSGTFEASHANLRMVGSGGSQSFQSGRFIISQISGVGNGGGSMGFSGTVVTSTGCDYWDDGLNGTLAGGTSQAGHVRFETDCNTGRPTSIISFAYGP